MKKLNYVALSFLCLFILACASFKSRPPSATMLVGETAQDHQAIAKEAMVVSQGPNATAAGLEILAAGGNAVDAAIAVSFTIGVERPQSTGIGGGGFALVGGVGKEVMAYDFREQAPETVKAEMYLDINGKPNYQKSQDGALSIATPGLVAGLYQMHLEHGKLAWKDLVRPAIRLAKTGFTIYAELATALEKRSQLLATFPSSKKVFFAKDGSILKQGDLLVQNDLAHSLELIAAKGDKGFYYGSVAQNIAKTIKDFKGLVSLADLRKYRAKKRPAVSSKMGDSFQKVEIFSMPPPSSGGVHVLQILNMMEEIYANKSKPEYWSTEAIHNTALAMQQAFYDRAAFLADPDFVKVPTKLLTSKEYAKRAVQNFSYRARKMQDIKSMVMAGEESFETTHFSIMDKEGMVVSSTQTINGWFGSGLVAENTGIVLNNEMDDFAISLGGGNLFGAYGGEKNFVAPLKRPLSSMSPTIVMKDGSPFMVLGSPSGTRIITCVALTLLNYLFYQMPLADAVAATRYHQQWSPDELWMEKEGMNSSVVQQLIDRGHNVVEKELGCKIQAIVHRVNQPIEGVSDIRGAGLAKGL